MDRISDTSRALLKNFHYWGGGGGELGKGIARQMTGNDEQGSVFKLTGAFFHVDSCLSGI